MQQALHKEKLYLVSYSIPLSCIVVLLLVSMAGIVTLSNYSGMAKAMDGVEDHSGIPSVHSDVNTSTVSLSIGGDDQSVATEAGIGTVAYRRHTVTVELDNVAQYFLKFYGAEKLVPVDGGVNVDGIGTTPVIGREIAQGTWGYAWDASSTVDDEEMQYKTVPTTSSDLTGPELIDNSLTFTGKLNFAANFPSNATLGSYTSTATLTLIATPKANTGIINYWRTPEGGITAVDAGTDEMQGVGPDFCGSDVGEGWTIDLRDNRGDESVTYTIYKAADGNCWMGQNLALSTDNPDGLNLTSGDTDLPEGEVWNMPRSVGSGGTNENNVNTSNAWDISNNNVVQIRTGSTSLERWKDGYGNYYSWCAATAGSCSSVTIGEVNAPASICPKGWRLPTNISGNHSFQDLINIKSGWLTNQTINGITGMGGYYLGSVKTTIYKSANFWPAAGFINQANGMFSAAGTTVGLYWSRRASSDNNAYNLNFSSSDISVYGGMNGILRANGLSVRCVYDQEPLGIWKNNAGGKGSFDSELRNMQDITKTNFTNRYCAKTATDVVVGATVRLRDSRDKKTYNVVKLEDGNCWMQENLALSGSKVLTNADSDITASSWTLPTDTGWGSGSTGIYVKTGSISLRNWQPEYGNYYSWNAATAGTGDSITSGQASGSICPKGWKLPTGNTGGQFDMLFGSNSEFSKVYPTAQTKFVVIQQVPYKFPTAGNISEGGGLGNTGSYGFYWSRTPQSSVSNAYRLGFKSDEFVLSSFSAGAYVIRYFGFSVRCIAEPGE